MALDDPTRAEILNAIDAALSGNWDTAHVSAQRHEGVPVADWLHAVLHKIEGDEGNSRYWYRCSGLMDYERFPDPKVELRAIFDELTRQS